MGIYFIIVVAIVILSVVLHEVMHGYVADRMGDPTARHQGRLTLNPIPHIDPLGSVIIPALLFISQSPFLIAWAKPVPYNPHNLSDKKYGEAKVAAAGPATNLIIAFLFGMIVRFGGGVLSDPFIAISALITLVNIVLGIFNLIPFPPLDGSKVLFAFLPARFQYLRGVLEQYWYIAIILLILLIVYFLSPVIIFFFELLTGSGIGIALL